MQLKLIDPIDNPFSKQSKVIKILEGRIEKCTDPHIKRRLNHLLKGAKNNNKKVLDLFNIYVEGIPL